MTKSELRPILDKGSRFSLPWQLIEPSVFIEGLDFHEPQRLKSMIGADNLR
jgi:hypothetical protein